MNRPRKRLRFLLDKAVPVAARDLIETSESVTFLPMEAIGEHGELDLVRTISFDEASPGLTIFFDGDVVVAKITPCFENGKGALIENTATGIGLGTTELYVLRPGKDLDGRFLYYITADPTFRGLGETQMIGAAGQKRVPENFVRDYLVSTPPISEQVHIARFLDSELAVVDTLIDAKQKLLGLLAEKRRTMVSEAVMRGLDRSAPLRPSGIDWLGDIPAHWEVRRLATLFTERDERNEPDLPLLEVSINTGVSVRQFSTTQIEGTAADFNTYKVARKGSIAFNKMRMWQGAVGVAPTDGLISPDYVVAEPSSEISAGFAGLLFRTPAFSAECARRSQGITWDRLRLYWEGFRDISIGLPPLNEQRQIIELQEQEASKIDKLATATERSIALLKERRGALISAAVTGQVAIPEAA
jgi:type I restriction enzyme S subunit